MRRLDPPIDLGPDLAFLRELWALDHALQERKRFEGGLPSPHAALHAAAGAG